MMDQVVIDRRFCGPKHSGNGGYCAGLFAQLIDGPAEVVLMAPPPLDTPIDLVKTDIGGEARVDDQLIASVKPAVVSVDATPAFDDAAIYAAREAFLEDAGDEHVLPFCFVCGNRRDEGDGLRIFSGPVPGHQYNADFWTPGDDLGDEDGLVRTEFIWAALDCPTAFSLRLWPRLTLLGKFAVEVKKRPKTGEQLAVIAWPEKSEGRKHYASAVLVDAQRNVLAASNALWVEIKDEKMLAQFAADRGAE